MPSKSVLIAQAFSKTGVLSTVVDSAPSVNTGQVEVATSADLPNTGNTQGDFAFVQATNRLYLWSGSGWYNIALINTTPTWDSNGQPAGSYVLDADSPQTATTITLAASDPEGISINYSYITGGSMDSIATVSQDSSVFTITPKTSTQAPDGGTGSITFRASDGVNILPQVSSFTLNFISIITDSKYTTLLATATGTSDNNNITDSSSNSHSITVNNDAYAGTFSPYRHGGYSTYFPDTAGNVYVSANSSDYALGSGALTVSAWIYIDNNTQEQTIIDNQTGSGTGWYLKIWPGQLIRVHNQSSYIFNISNSDAPTAVNEWIHLCWTRDGSGNNKLFLNGTQVGTTVSDTTNFTAQGCKLGETHQGVHDYKGYMKDVHIVAGYANEPTASSIATAVTSDTGTVFLGCSGPDFLERSSSSKTINISNNNIFIRSFSPYDNLEYAATDHGGSVYFDTSDDYLTVPNGSWKTYGSSNFTIECWFYADRDGMLWGDSSISGLGDNCTVIAELKDFSGANAWVQVEFRVGSTKYGINPAQGTFKRNTWNHIAFVRNGNTFTVYSNGKDVGNTSQSGSMNTSPNDWAIASAMPNATGTQFNGYISDFRVSKSARYTAEFTPPTAPLSSSGAELHIKGTDASIIDKSQGSNLKLVGNTTGSTITKFTGAKSMYFDGNGDYADTTIEPIGAGDFTVEFWVNDDGSGTTGQQEFSGYLSLASGGSQSTGIFFSRYNFMVGGNSTVWGTGWPNTFTVEHGTGWHHIAMSRSGTTVKVYVDGTLEHTVTGISADLTNTDLRIASRWNDNVSYLLPGYIQDVRITKGLARYTSNFTPPTASLEG